VEVNGKKKQEQWQVNTTYREMDAKRTFNERFDHPAPQA
jgi:hypothetical protein